MEPQADAKPTLKQCSACQVSFETDDARRTHAKSSWHVENIRRRVAGLDPITESTPLPSFPAPESQKKSSKRARSRRLPPRSEEDSSDDTLGSLDSDDDTTTSTPFIPEQCLFCNETSPSFPDSLAHMKKAHGLFIPDQDRLVVDLETLIQYLRFVIFQYRECLFCHSQRRTVEAAQQHMLGKGHCKFDIDKPGSEYRDFFDLSKSDKKVPRPGDQDSTHLPSGKIVSSRTAPQASQPRTQGRLNDVPDSSTQPGTSSTNISTDTPSAPASSSLALTARDAKRGDHLASQLSRLSANDRTSLAHLPTSQQLAILATQQKQADAETRKERRFRTRVELLDRSTLSRPMEVNLPWTTSKYPGR